MGFILTMQKEFRKIDRKRLIEAAFPLTDIDGTANEEETAQLSLYILHLIGALSIKRDAVYASLKKLEHELSAPAEFLVKVISSFRDKPNENALFTPPFAPPAQLHIKTLLSLLSPTEGMNVQSLKIAYLLKKLPFDISSALANPVKYRASINKRVHTCAQAFDFCRDGCI